MPKEQAKRIGHAERKTKQNWETRTASFSRKIPDISIKRQEH